MNLFVTGGTGYLSTVTRCSPPATPSALTCAPPRRPVGRPPGDLSDPVWLRAHINESDGVVHTASPIDTTNGSFDTTFVDVALSELGGCQR
jgi:nucleoside-diphosphate-sugar epimerase